MIEINEDKTHTQVLELLKTNKRTPKEFYQFMAGQTVCMNEEGDTVYFADDIYRFFNNKPVID